MDAWFDGLEQISSGTENGCLEAIRAASTIGQRAVEPLLHLMNDPRSPRNIRYEAARALRTLDYKVLMPKLIKQLGDTDALTRDRTAWLLGWTGNNRAVAPLLERLRHETDRTVRSEIALALGHLQAELAVHPLIERMVARDTSNICEALVHIGGAAIEPLVAVLRDRSVDENVRILAAACLGKLGGRQSTTTMRVIFGNSKEDVRVRTVAASILTDLDDQNSIGMAIEVLSRQDTPDSVAVRAITLISRLNDPWITALLALIADDVSLHSTVRAEAAEVVRHANPQHALDIAAELVDDDLPDVAHRMSQWLGISGDAIDLALNERRQWSTSTNPLIHELARQAIKRIVARIRARGEQGRVDEEG